MLNWGTNHEEWSNDPVYYNAETDLYPERSLLEQMMQRLILDFAQDRIHHYEQSDGYRNRNVSKLALLQRGPGRLDKVSKQHADDHGEQDPYSEEAVEPAEAFDDWNGLLAFRDGTLLLRFYIGV